MLTRRRSGARVATCAGGERSTNKVPPANVVAAVATQMAQLRSALSVPEMTISRPHVTRSPPYEGDLGGGLEDYAGLNSISMLSLNTMTTAAVGADGGAARAQQPLRVGAAESEATPHGGHAQAQASYHISRTRGPPLPPIPRRPDGSPPSPPPTLRLDGRDALSASPGRGFASHHAAAAVPR